MSGLQKTGFGGGCHWCTEAVFDTLKGVETVEQGWIASLPPHDAFSEAVLVSYNPATITLADLLQIHLLTHASTSNHSMRHKYRSAIYCFTKEREAKASRLLHELQAGFEAPLITKVLPFAAFKPSGPEYRQYYYSDPAKPFCQVYIHPKLQALRRQFSRLVKEDPKK